MAYIAPVDKFAMLNNALGGVSKGLTDYAAVKLETNKMAQQQAQFDQQMNLAFTKLDEQIRQFDVGTEQHERLTKAKMDLEATLTREGIVSAEKQTTQRVRAQNYATSVRKNIAKRQAEIDDRLFEATRSSQLAQSMGYDALAGKDPGPFDPNTHTEEGYAVEKAKYDKDVRNWAVQYMTVLSGDPNYQVTEIDIQRGISKFNSMPAERAQTTQLMMEKAKADAIARGHTNALLSGSNNLSGGLDMKYTGAKWYPKDPHTGQVNTTGAAVSQPDEGWMNTLVADAQQLELEDPMLRAGAKASVEKFRSYANQILGDRNPNSQKELMQRLEYQIRDEKQWPGVTADELFQMKLTLDDELNTRLYASATGPDAQWVKLSTRAVAGQQSQVEKYREIQQQNPDMTQPEIQQEALRQKRELVTKTAALRGREVDYDTSLYSQNPDEVVNEQGQFDYGMVE